MGIGVPLRKILAICRMMAVEIVRRGISRGCICASGHGPG